MERDVTRRGVGVWDCLLTEKVDHPLKWSVTVSVELEDFDETDTGAAGDSADDRGVCAGR
jgi:hypothetical protein